MNHPELSIIILCYKAGEFVKNFVDDTKKLLAADDINNYEIILVGNYQEGADDKTPFFVAELAASNQRIRFVAKPKEGMMGWDMKSGFEIAQGEYLVVIDGDGQMPIEDLIKVYKEIRNKKLDLVKTYRLTRGDGLRRKILSFGYNAFFHLLFPGINSHDINSKPKIISRQAYEKLHLESDDWFIDAEIMIQARRYNFSIGEIPTHFFGLKGGRKSFVSNSTVFEFIKNLIIYRIKEFKFRLK